MNEQWHQNCFYRVSLKALIRNEKGEILMVAENEASNLSLPGGGMDHGETAHECLQRELYEEIALTSDFNEKLVHMQTRWLDTHQAWLMWLVYKIEYKKLEFSLGEDGVLTKWVAPEHLIGDDAASKTIREALNNE